MSPASCDSTFNPRSVLVQCLALKSYFSCGIAAPRYYFGMHLTLGCFGEGYRLQALPCSSLPFRSRRVSYFTWTFLCPSSSVNFDEVDGPSIPSQIHPNSSTFSFWITCMLFY